MIFVVIVDEKHGVVWFRLVYSLDEFLIKDQATVIWEVSRIFPHTNWHFCEKKLAESLYFLLKKTETHYPALVDTKL